MVTPSGNRFEVVSDQLDFIGTFEVQFFGPILKPEY